MPEGLSPQEVGKEIAEHAKHSVDGRRGHLVSIAEAVLLSIVALLAAWSGYAASKWSTESRVELAKASAARTEANRADLEAMEIRNFDSSTFEAWFAAYTAHNKHGDGPGGASLPSRIPRCVRRMACHEPRDEPQRATGADLHAPVPTAGAWGGCITGQPGGRCLRFRRKRGRDCRQVRPRDRLPCERPVHRRDQHALPVTRAVWPGCAWGCDAGALRRAAHAAAWAPA